MNIYTGAMRIVAGSIFLSGFMLIDIYCLSRLTRHSAISISRAAGVFARVTPGVLQHPRMCRSYIIMPPSNNCERAATSLWVPGSKVDGEQQSNGGSSSRFYKKGVGLLGAALAGAGLYQVSNADDRVCRSRKAEDWEERYIECLATLDETRSFLEGIKAKRDAKQEEPTNKEYLKMNDLFLRIYRRSRLLLKSDDIKDLHSDSVLLRRCLVQEMAPILCLLRDELKKCGHFEKTCSPDQKNYHGVEAVRKAVSHFIPKVLSYNGSVAQVVLSNGVLEHAALLAACKNRLYLLQKSITRITSMDHQRWDFSRDFLVAFDNGVFVDFLANKIESSSHVSSTDKKIITTDFVSAVDGLREQFDLYCKQEVERYHRPKIYLLYDCVGRLFARQEARKRAIAQAFPNVMAGTPPVVANALATKKSWHSWFTGWFGKSK